MQQKGRALVGGSVVAGRCSLYAGRMQDVCGLSARQKSTRTHWSGHFFSADFCIFVIGRFLGRRILFDCVASNVTRSSSEFGDVG
jgi:hypothetical protein